MVYIIEPGRLLDACTFVAGNLKNTCTETAANLRISNRVINDSDPARIRVNIEKELYLNAKILYEQIKTERANYYPVRLDPANILNWLSQLLEINSDVNILRGDYIENLDEIYQFNGISFEPIDIYIVSHDFEFITQFRNPTYFHAEFIIENDAFSEDEAMMPLSSFGRYGYIPAHLQLEPITDYDRHTSRKFDKLVNYEWVQYKINYNNLVYFIGFDGPVEIIIRNGINYYPVDLDYGSFFLAYIKIGHNSFGTSFDKDIKYLLSL
jgi:hypothetical protein